MNSIEVNWRGNPVPIPDGKSIISRLNLSILWSSFRLFFFLIFLPRMGSCVVRRTLYDEGMEASSGPCVVGAQDDRTVGFWIVLCECLADTLVALVQLGVFIHASNLYSLDL